MNKEWGMRDETPEEEALLAFVCRKANKERHLPVAEKLSREIVYLQKQNAHEKNESVQCWSRGPTTQRRRETRGIRLDERRGGENEASRKNPKRRWAKQRVTQKTAQERGWEQEGDTWDCGSGWHTLSTCDNVSRDVWRHQDIFALHGFCGLHERVKMLLRQLSDG